MGAYVPPTGVFNMQAALNTRFAEGDAIKEMVVLQRIFDMFSKKHELSQSLPLLGIAPMDATARAGWRKFLDNLHTYDSDVAGIDGHDRMRSAIRDNLLGSALPMFFTYHLAADNPALFVTQRIRIAISRAKYVSVSAPVTEPRAAKRAAVKQARASRAAGVRKSA